MIHYNNISQSKFILINMLNINKVLIKKTWICLNRDKDMERKIGLKFDVNYKVSQNELNPLSNKVSLKSFYDPNGDKIKRYS